MKKTVDEKLFRAVKIMTAGGASVKEIAEYFQISNVTVSRIRAAETLEEYKHQIIAVHAKYTAKRKAEAEQATEAPKQAENPAPVQRTVMSQHYTDNRVLEALREQNELLKLISAKLAFIVEQLA